MVKPGVAIVKQSRDADRGLHELGWHRHLADPRSSANCFGEGAQIVCSRSGKMAAAGTTSAAANRPTAMPCLGRAERRRKVPRQLSLARVSHGDLSKHAARAILECRWLQEVPDAVRGCAASFETAAGLPASDMVGPSGRSDLVQRSEFLDQQGGA